MSDATKLAFIEDYQNYEREDKASLKLKEIVVKAAEYQYKDVFNPSMIDVNHWAKELALEIYKFYANRYFRQNRVL